MSRAAYRSTATGVLIGVGAALSVTAASVLATGIVSTLHQTSAAPWVLGRASGLTSYVLVTALVLLGLSMSHPGSPAVRRPSLSTRLVLHSSLAVFALAFTTLHVVVLATDPYAGVGWRGLAIPMASHYRPVGVTLGVLAAWSMVVTAVTAALAGRLLGRLWWPIHKAAILAFVLVWAHGFAAGSDSPALAVFYLATGATVQLAAVSRYTATPAAQRLAQSARQRRVDTTPGRSQT